MFSTTKEARLIGKRIKHLGEKIEEKVRPHNPRNF